MILTCLPVECRVLAGMITDRDILALCDDVESSDFVEMRHVTVLYGIRAVQERGERICAESVADAVQQLALDWGAVAMAEKVDTAFIESLIAKAPPGGLRTIRRDVARLRSDREFRERIYAANLKSLQESR